MIHLRFRDFVSNTITLRFAYIGFINLQWVIAKTATRARCLGYSLAYLAISALKGGAFIPDEPPEP